MRSWGIYIALFFGGVFLGGLLLNMASRSVEHLDSTATLARISFESANDISVEDDSIQPRIIFLNELFLEIADTPEERRQGLSGRILLPENTGLLFVFNEDDLHGFWMKEMNFSIDMIWLSERGRVVDFYENVAPETFPDIFTPKSVARFVLETNAGFVASADIKRGDRAIIRGISTAEN